MTSSPSPSSRSHLNEVLKDQHQSLIAHSDSISASQDVHNDQTTNLSQSVPLVHKGELSRSRLDKTNKMLQIRKLSWYMYISNILSFGAFLLAWGFLSFLWFGTEANFTWKRIATDGYIPPLTTLSSAVIRTTAAVHAAMASCMLASIFTEEGRVLLKDLATVSVMRTNSSPLSLSWPIIQAVTSKAPGARKSFLPILAILLLFTDIALQFTSTILVSDLRMGLVPGSPVAVNVTAGRQDYDLKRYSPGPQWDSKPAFFPTFAEYSNDKVKDPRDGVSDSGIVLRAFLPLIEPAQRSTIHRYQGVATVIDVRSVCVRPNITRLIYNTTARSGVWAGRVLGSVNIPKDLRTRSDQPYKSWKFQLDSQEYTQFNCTMPLMYGSTTYSAWYHQNDWNFTLCRLTNHSLATLQSEFFDLETYNSWTSNSYLAIKTSGIEDFVDGLVIGGILRTYNEGEWLHVIFNNTRPYRPRSGEYRVSFSLCFSSLDGFDMLIDARSTNNRTEPSPGRIDGSWRYDGIRKQLGQFGGTSVERGVLELQERDWIRVRASSKRDSYLADIGGFSRDNLMFASQTNDSVHPDVAMLMQEILKTSGRLSFALQSMSTLFAGMAYYQQLSQFTTTSMTNQTYFEAVQIPGGNSQHQTTPAGFLPGYTAVSCILVLHCTLICIIQYLFFYHTKISTLHNVWQSIAQLNSKPAWGYLVLAARADDDQVEEWIRQDGYDNCLAGIKGGEIDGETEVILRRRRTIDTDT